MGFFSFLFGNKSSKEIQDLDPDDESLEPIPIRSFFIMTTPDDALSGHVHIDASQCDAFHTLDD
ncbi:hypothetical protein [Delftia sp. PS-11]|uniref:hypothetical protein n=1 Tax=Delftia sp. PS-11 TaxID=2767222 RepID=UPI00245553FB|nr:hypothetical protein [Delftia sp. PS-11]KAJ8744151.1 hypothetical protein H9T68_14130 [Delftia sp. PS-11]